MKNLRVQFKWENELPRVCMSLVQRSANFFCKGLDSKYFRLWRPYSLYISSVQKSHSKCINVWVWQCANKTLFAEKGSDQIWPVCYYSFTLAPSSASLTEGIWVWEKKKETLVVIICPELVTWHSSPHLFLIAGNKHIYAVGYRVLAHLMREENKVQIIEVAWWGPISYK